MPYLAGAVDKVINPVLHSFQAPTATLLRLNPPCETQIRQRLMTSPHQDLTRVV